MDSIGGTRSALKASPGLGWRRVCAVLLASALAALCFGATAVEAQASDAIVAAKKPAKKKSCKTTQKLAKGKCVAKCKKTQVLKKGKCVKKKAAVTPTPKPQGPTPDPNSDADGDGLPYKWEVQAAPAPVPTKPGKTCKKGQKLSKGKCVKRCGKAQVLKKGKCVKKAKKKAKRKLKARASDVAAMNLHAYGANPNRKDVFVQVDFASAALRDATVCAQFDTIYDAFANAPVSNPDGSTGITLHIDAGKVCPSRSYDLGGSTTFDAGTACPTGPQIFQTMRPPEGRVGAFHFSGFGPTCGTGGDGGMAQQPGILSAVYTEGNGFAMPFMHELGHNLGLGHDATPVPNRFSVMNGRIQRSPNDGGAIEIVDYQRISLPALDENALSEAAGIGHPPEVNDYYVQHWCADLTTPAYRNAWLGHGTGIDWNCNTVEGVFTPPPTIDPGTVAADVNRDGQKTVLPATGNEWLQLDYDANGSIGKELP